MTTHSIKSGGSYTTITSFEADADTYWSSASDVFHGEIQASSQFDESDITIDFSTTPTSSKYLELSTAAANFPADGVYSTSKAYLTQGGSGHVITNNEAYTYLHHLQIHQDGGGSSDEGIRQAGDDGLISYCIIKTNNVSNQDCIYLINTSGFTYCIDNCFFYDAGRLFINIQDTGGGPTIYVDHCFGAFGEWAFGSHNGDHPTVTYNIYNCYGSDCTLGVFGGNGIDNVTWNGSNNASDDISAETYFTSSYDSADLVSTTPGSGENFWVVDASSDDFTIEGENAYTISENGTDRIGSEPDARQDFTYDITGETRSSTPNIGPFAYGDGIASGGVEVTPVTIGAVTASVNPTIQLASISLTPAVRSAVTASAPPATEQGSLSLTPAVTAAIAASVNPTTLLGSLAFTKIASAIAASVNPTIPGTDVVVTPNPVGVIAASVNPTYLAGSLAITAAAISAVVATVDPDISTGGASVNPAAAGLVAATVSPVVLFGSAVVTAVISARATAMNPSVDGGAPPSVFGNITREESRAVRRQVAFEETDMDRSWE